MLSLLGCLHSHSLYMHCQNNPPLILDPVCIYICLYRTVASCLSSLICYILHGNAFKQVDYNAFRNCFQFTVIYEKNNNFKLHAWTLSVYRTLSHIPQMNPSTVVVKALQEKPQLRNYCLTCAGLFKAEMSSHKQERENKHWRLMPIILLYPHALAVIGKGLFVSISMDGAPSFPEVPLRNFQSCASNSRGSTLTEVGNFKRTSWQSKKLQNVVDLQFNWRSSVSLHAQIPTLLDPSHAQSVLSKYCFDNTRTVKST